MSNLDDAILRHVNDPKYRPVKPKVICKKLGLENDDFSKVKRAVKFLVKKGKLAYGPSHLVCPITSSHPAAQVGESPTRRESSKHVVGTFRRAAAGFGFVRPEGTPASEGRDADIFVPANATGDAANGDTVRLRLSSKPGRKGKLEGRVVDVVERANSRFVGTYLVKDGAGLVQVDGKVFTSPVYVGDPGAKGAQTDDKVVIDMVRHRRHPWQARPAGRRHALGRPRV